MRSAQLYAAAADLDAASRSLTDASSRHDQVATAAARAFGGIPGAWTSPEPEQLTAASDGVVAAGRSTRAALTGASSLSRGLGRTASGGVGAVVGGVVGSSVGNKVGSFVHDRVGPAIGDAAKGAVDTQKKLKFW